ncbi:hypothetical protein JMJ35_001989 [Cladonia borealis]|uniref:Uncharacterized protein n=1 Tax=Cladonia borealis TaxID=184061 RepID=A0AA39V9M5_9LECA|nr:hypothetical protein JMJ35_001989 [Cladonia borealis]
MPHHLVILPLEVLQECFRHLLVVHDQALILCPDSSTPPAYRTSLQPSLLRVCRRFYQIGLPLLYGENTFTTSSSATSIDFDAHLSSLPGKNRQLITKIVLKIDWAILLWSIFPLIARQIAELKSLRQLEIIISDGNDPKPVRYPRDGPYGAVMLKSEKKALEELVSGLKGLRMLKLEGFLDDDFAKALEAMVNGA